MEHLKAIADYFWWPAFSIFIVILVTIIWAVYKIGKVSEKIKTVDKLNDNIDTIRTGISEMSGNIGHMMKRIDLIETANSTLAQRHSPIKLTEKGEWLLDRTIKPYIDTSFIDILKKYPEIKKLTNPFDIEQFAKRIALDVYENFTSENEKDKIKSTLFMEGATMGDLNLITGIYLRDKFFENKGIDLNKLDE